MSEPTSAPDQTPEVPKAPSFTYDTPAAATPSEPLPPPSYGERMPDYAAAPAYGTPGYGAPVPTVKRRRTWDLVLTVILLVVGLFGLLIGLFYAWAFSDPVLLDQAMGQGGMGGFNGTVGAGPTIIAVSHVTLYLVALGVSILLLVKNKIAFWVPLSAGVIAAIVFWGVLVSILMSDPDLMGSLYR